MPRLKTSSPTHTEPVKSLAAPRRQLRRVLLFLADVFLKLAMRADPTGFPIGPPPASDKRSDESYGGWYYRVFGP